MKSGLEKQYMRWFRKAVRVPKSAKVPLVSAYLTLYGGKRKLALGKINRILGTGYKMRRFREWERGSTKIPTTLKFHMQEAVIKSRFGDSGGDLLQLLDLESCNSDLL